MDELRSFDVLSWLDDIGIYYRTSGKNTSRGWISLSCPFCGDGSNHLGIHKESKMYKCWICGAKGNAIKLIQKISKCDYPTSLSILKSYQDFTFDESTLLPKANLNSKVEFPLGMTEVFNKIHLNYLMKRNFDPEYIIRKYSLKACYNIGDPFFKFRIIVPVFLNASIVSYVGIDVTKKSSIPYRNSSKEKSIRSVNECVYNFDTIRDAIIIVEGIVDSWRLGDGAIATFGIQFTEDQVNLIRSKKIKKAVIMYDDEDFAIKQAHKLAKQLAFFIPQVDVFELKDGDPAELTDEQVKDLRKELSI